MNGDAQYLHAVIDKMLSAWPGDKEIAPARAIIASDRQPYSHERYVESLKFYTGDTQWDERIRRERQRNSRPCLIVNRLPGMFAVAIAKESAVSEVPLSDEENHRLIAAIVDRNRDAQTVFNYIVSSAVELDRAQDGQSEEGK